MKPTDLLTYSIDADVTAFTTTRHGGCSSGNYASMNANYYCGDNIANVENNREALCSLLGIHTQKLILSRQTHSTNILNIAPTHFTLDDTQRSHVLENVDALITSQTECAICVSTADCVPIIVYDKRLHVAAAHTCRMAWNCWTYCREDVADDASAIWHLRHRLLCGDWSQHQCRQLRGWG